MTEGAMKRIPDIRELALQFRLRALTVKDAALALELHELAALCEEKAARIDLASAGVATTRKPT
jgi:hypothetical protein